MRFCAVKLQLKLTMKVTMMIVSEMTTMVRTVKMAMMEVRLKMTLMVTMVTKVGKKIRITMWALRMWTKKWVTESSLAERVAAKWAKMEVRADRMKGAGEFDEEVQVHQKIRARRLKELSSN